MVDVIVLAGGAGRRLGGADKPSVEVAGRSLLAHVVAAAAALQPARVVVVGPARDLDADVVWCRESPPGGGPVAALAAALPHVTGDEVAVLAADLPTVGPALPRLRDALAAAPDHVAVCALVDAGGRVNHLAALWRTAALRAAVAEVGGPAGVAMRRLVATVEVITVPDTGGWGRDCDTWDDIAAARRDAGPSRGGALP